MKDGWVKLHRKIEDSAVFSNPKTLQVFIWCLCEARYTEGDQLVGRTVVHLLPGQFVTGRKAAAAKLSMPETTFRGHLKTLESLGIVAVNPTNKFSVVTIENWGFYQGEESNSRQQTDSKSPTNGHKKEREEGKKPFSSTPESDRGECEAVMSAYNQLCPSLPRCMKLSDKRKRAIRARLKSGFTLDDFEKAFTAAEKSDFLSGRKAEWKAGFDWLLNENNLVKVLEGNYENIVATTSAPQTETADWAALGF